MFISRRLRTTYGLVLAAEPISLSIPTDPQKALAFAAVIDRQADHALAEGRTVQAEKLAHLALEARCRATGERA